MRALVIHVNYETCDLRVSVDVMIPISIGELYDKSSNMVCTIQLI